MVVRNLQKDALAASLTPSSLGRAMAQLDLSSVPSEKRKAALMDHLMRIMADTIHDRSAAAEITAARLLRYKLRGSPHE